MTINSTQKKIMLIILIFILVLGVAFWFISQRAEHALTAEWQTFTDEIQKITFKYPTTLPSTYISLVDWPPQVIVMNVPFTCVLADIETGRAGETKSEKINGREYCVTTISENALPGVYTEYTYVLQKEDQQIVFAFSLKKAQCENFEEPESAECKKEQSSFNIGEMVDTIAMTLYYQ